VSKLSEHVPGVLYSKALNDDAGSHESAP